MLQILFLILKNIDNKMIENAANLFGKSPPPHIKEGNHFCDLKVLHIYKIFLSWKTLIPNQTVSMIRYFVVDILQTARTSNFCHLDLLDWMS